MLLPGKSWEPTTPLCLKFEIWGYPLTHWPIVPHINPPQFQISLNPQNRTIRYYPLAWRQSGTLNNPINNVNVVQWTLFFCLHFRNYEMILFVLLTWTAYCQVWSNSFVDFRVKCCTINKNYTACQKTNKRSLLHNMKYKRIMWYPDISGSKSGKR